MMTLRMDSFPDPVKQEFLMIEITGEVADDDYVGQAVHDVLKNHQIQPVEQLTGYAAEHSFAFEDAELLMDQGYLPMEDGWVRRADGSLFVACLTDLGEDVTGDMFDWWFCHCEDDDKFRWWHPYANLKATWDPSYYAAMPFERTRGHYVDHIFITEKVIGTQQVAVQFEFVRPSKVFDVSKFAENNITACLVARIYFKHATLGMVGIGHLIHIVREVDGRSELRTRVWIGDDITCSETPENYYFAQLVQNLASSSLVKMLKIPFDAGKDVYTHCSQSAACLTHILPAVYKAKIKEMNEFKKTYLSDV